MWVPVISDKKHAVCLRFPADNLLEVAMALVEITHSPGVLRGFDEGFDVSG